MSALVGPLPGPLSPTNGITNTTLVWDEEKFVLKMATNFYRRTPMEKPIGNRDEYCKGLIRNEVCTATRRGKLMVN